MRRYGLPVLPAIIAVILGPRAELQLRRTLQLSNGEISGLWSTPLAKFIYLIIAIVLLWPLLSRFLLRGRHPLQEAVAVSPPDAQPPAEDQELARAPEPGTPAAESDRDREGTRERP
jgi:putative tricarboxylic transport membrane protein